VKSLTTILRLRLDDIYDIVGAKATRIEPGRLLGFYIFGNAEEYLPGSIKFSRFRQVVIIAD
jgi:hypothetical protein